jgi:hypothetical protein
MWYAVEREYGLEYKGIRQVCDYLHIFATRKERNDWIKADPYYGKPAAKREPITVEQARAEARTDGYSTFWDHATEGGPYKHSHWPGISY